MKNQLPFKENHILQNDFLFFLEGWTILICGLESIQCLFNQNS